MYPGTVSIIGSFSALPTFPHIFSSSQPTLTSHGSLPTQPYTVTSLCRFSSVCSPSAQVLCQLWICRQSNCWFLLFFSTLWATGGKGHKLQCHREDQSSQSYAPHTTSRGHQPELQVHTDGCFFQRPCFPFTHAAEFEWKSTACKMKKLHLICFACRLNIPHQDMMNQKKKQSNVRQVKCSFWMCTTA